MTDLVPMTSMHQVSVILDFATLLEKRNDEELSLLVESKLTPPHRSIHLLPVPRIEKQFDTTQSKRVISLVAPAGHGKSTTLAKQRDRAKQRGDRVGWVSLDSGDNDLLLFLQYVITSIHRTESDIGLDALAQLHPNSVSSPNTILRSLFNDLAKSKNRFVLVLDDYHVIENESVHRTVNWLLTNSPRNLAFLFGSRTPLPLSLAKLRLADDINEICAEDLCLHRNEVGPFVTLVSQKTLTEKQSAVLYARTEGWIAGLQLAALALRKMSDVDAFLDAFSGSDRDISSYLGEIVLDNLPPDISRFLSASALFDRFSAKFCEDVLGEWDAAKLIERICSCNLFLVSLDRNGQWYRYHPLFAEYLKDRFIATHRAKASLFYRTASRWFLADGALSQAIQYAFAGQDYAYAADLIAQHGLGFVRRHGKHNRLFEWVSALPPEVAKDRCDIKVPYIWSLIFSHRYARYARAESELQEMQRLIERHKRQSQGMEARGIDAELVCAAEMLDCIFYSQTYRTAVSAQMARGWLLRWENSAMPYDLGSVQLIAGYCSYIAGHIDFKQATHLLSLARGNFEKSIPYLDGPVWTDSLHGLATFEHGDVTGADRVLEEGARINAEKFSPYSYGASILALIHTHVQYEQNKINEASRALEKHAEFAKDHGFTETTSLAYLTKARILWMSGSCEEADACLLEGISILNAPYFLSAAHTLQEERIHFFLKSGLVERALQVARAIGLACAPDGSPNQYPQLTVPDTAMRMIEIRIQLATGQTTHTHRLLTALISEARRLGRGTWLIRLLCLMARYHQMAGNQFEAISRLEEALSLGAVGGHFRVFVDEGLPIAILIQEILKQKLSAFDDHDDIPSEYMTRLLDAMGSATSAPLADTAEAQTGPLSAREVQILKLANNGLNNRDLAAQLFVSEGTVKWHLHNIYVKLGAGNRSGAISRAREIGVLT